MLLRLFVWLFHELCAFYFELPQVALLIAIRANNTCNFEEILPAMWKQIWENMTAQILSSRKYTFIAVFLQLPWQQDAKTSVYRNQPQPNPSQPVKPRRGAWGIGTWRLPPLCLQLPGVLRHLPEHGHLRLLPHHRHHLDGRQQIECFHITSVKGMFLRDNKWMRTWTQFVPYCVIFVGLGFILGMLSDQFITGWTAPSVQIPRAVISTILVSSFSHTHSYYHPSQ